MTYVVVAVDRLMPLSPQLVNQALTSEGAVAEGVESERLGIRIKCLVISPAVKRQKSGSVRSRVQTSVKTH